MQTTLGLKLDHNNISSYNLNNDQMHLRHIANISQTFFKCIYSDIQSNGLTPDSFVILFGHHHTLSTNENISNIFRTNFGQTSPVVFLSTSLAVSANRSRSIT